MNDPNKKKKIRTISYEVSLVNCTLATVLIMLTNGLTYYLHNPVIMIVTTILGIGVFYAVSVLYGKRISGYIKKLKIRLNDVANGNFSKKTEYSSDTGEMDELYNLLETVTRDFADAMGIFVTGLKELEKGNLSFKLPTNWVGDLNTISTVYNEITATLSDTFKDIDIASGQVTNGSAQVASGAQTLSQGTTEQAASIQELNAQIADISSRVNSTATSAKNTMDIVKETGVRIAECSKEMELMLSSMEDINTSSNEISKIIKVIDDIAFQTNILALNAAVEAARAGAAGKGFAVVADEVRNLAAKSAEAANQTTALIQGSVEKVERGSKIAKDTAKVLEAIVTDAAKIDTEVRKISEASVFQADEIKRVTVGVEQISAVVQSNTATAEESAAASEELSGQSGILKQLLSHFKYEDDGELFGSFESNEPDLSYEETAYEAPSYSEPAYSEPTYSEPSYSEPAYEPVTTFSERSDEDFVPVDFTSEQFHKPLSKPDHIYLDDDFENVNSKY